MAEPLLRVLVVDDSTMARAWCRQILEAAGYEVEEALNGLEALEKVLGAPFDLIVVDVNMPQMDGMTFLRTLRRQPIPVAGTPVLVASSEAGAQDRAAARAAGANFYLVKPLTEDVLLAHVAVLSGRVA